MKKSALLFNIFLITILFFGTGVKAAVAGSSLYFDPATGTHMVGSEFSVTVKMESGGVIIPGADGKGTYDSTRLELLKIEKSPSLVFNGTGSPGDCVINDSGIGKFSFSCYSTLDSNSNSGDVVIFSFKAKATGTAKVNFDCVDASTTDTNIWNESVHEIIVCSENKNGSYEIIAGSGDPAPTSAPADNGDAVEAEELPQAGGFGATLGLILFGLVSVASAVVLKFL